MKIYVNLWQYLAEFFLEWEKLQTIVDKIKSHVFGAKPSSENRVIYEIMWKNMVQTDKPQTEI